MILSKIYYKEGKIAGFQIEGHAPKEFGEKGENLLCAGVSVLLQSVHSYLGWKERLEAESKREGFLRFMVQSEHLADFQTIGEMVRFGLQNLASQHGNAIQISEEIIKG
ncbi:ribosomal-processing cysteine protease Prp [Leptospira ognonensis]|uniref:Ribosomal processing cysteine protease Prp n=1 Tax=Leptospira ognonensis TaxID=2484945 RepID=A0A4R9JWT7_9LEPT|nr:ribosomal-processing cysteine protease Prp [Leptospira ognonensis]TGL57500.1 ribosomal-processing cysteine protease Prp [Leptospira ognonensis]